MPRRLSLLLASLLPLLGCSPRPAAEPSAESPEASAPPSIASHAEVVRYCGACHAYPSPDLFPRSSWAFEVRRGFDFGKTSDRPLDPPDLDSVVRYYESKAPEALPTLAPTPPSPAPPFAFARRAIAGPGDAWSASTSFVDLVRLEGSDRPSLLLCDLVNGLVLSGDPSSGAWTTLTDRVSHPGHAELADLDGDGHADLLISDLGIPSPSDDLLGQVVWLKGKGDGTFDEAPRAILTGVGRVADARAADFDGDGDLDVVAAVFGYLRAGGIVWLENLGDPGDGPSFRPTTVDPRHGAIHVPIVDLDLDGRPDFVALISQEHEAVVAYLNRGPGRFEPVELFRAPHPAFGSSGLDLADLDGDGDLDLLISNGDVYDSPLIKPYHGVSWLENLGGLKFEPRPLGPLYGAHRARAADLDGDGDLDIVASSFLAGLEYGRERAALNADAVVVFEQTSPGVFSRHALEGVSCDYPTLCLGDLDLDGDTDILLGSFHHAASFSPDAPPPGPEDRESVVVLENLGKAGP